VVKVQHLIRAMPKFLAEERQGISHLQLRLLNSEEIP
jgi:hypothetical protein